jgi:hypothetical protein
MKRPVDLVYSGDLDLGVRPALVARNVHAPDDVVDLHGPLGIGKDLAQWQPVVEPVERARVERQSVEAVVLDVVRPRLARRIT